MNAGQSEDDDHSERAPRYYAEPVWRFVLLCFVSLSAYEFYWMYKNWQQIKRADRSDLMPFVRTLFGPVTYFSLIEDLYRYGAAHPYKCRGLSPLLAFGYLLSSATVDRLPDPWWLVGVLNVFFLVPAVQRIWLLSSVSQRCAATPWAWRHSVAVVLGIALWAWVVFPMFSR